MNSILRALAPDIDSSSEEEDRLSSITDPEMMPLDKPLSESQLRIFLEQRASFS